MRRVLRWLTVIVFVLLLVVVGLLTLMRGEIERRQAVFRVREAQNAAEAQRELAWFQTPPERDKKLDTLMHAWGRGQDQLDLYVLQFLREPACDEAFRARFAAELSARPELLPRWAHYWCWSAEREPAVELTDLRDHLALLAATEDQRSLAWRELLDMVALFELTGQGKLAQGLTPENWHERFRAWQAAVPKELPAIERPTTPLSEGVGD